MGVTVYYTYDVTVTKGYKTYRLTTKSWFQGIRRMRIRFISHEPSTKPKYSS